MKSTESAISLELAQRTVLANMPRMSTVEVALENAARHVLAEHVVSDVDMPPFDKSAMDGYAVRGEDVASAPAGRQG